MSGASELSIGGSINVLTNGDQQSGDISVLQRGEMIRVATGDATRGSGEIAARSGDFSGEGISSSDISLLSDGSINLGAGRGIEAGYVRLISGAGAIDGTTLGGNFSIASMTGEDTGSIIFVGSNGGGINMRSDESLDATGDIFMATGDSTDIESGSMRLSSGKAAVGSDVRIESGASISSTGGMLTVLSGKSSQSVSGEIRLVAHRDGGSSFRTSLASENSGMISLDAGRATSEHTFGHPLSRVSYGLRWFSGHPQGSQNHRREGTLAFPGGGDYEPPCIYPQSNK